MTAYERTGWRGEQWFSQWHRTLGSNLPATDLDKLLFLEYDHGVPCALIDLKCRFPVVLADNANYRAQRVLADNSKIPFLLVFYSPSKRFFAAQPMNGYARRFWAGKSPLMSEQQFVDQLYRLHGFEDGAPSYITRDLSKVVPTQATWPRYEPNQG